MLLALSEISFGARIFDIEMPQMHGGGEFDGGHDIVIVVVRLIADAGSAGVLVAATGAAVLSAMAAVLIWTFRPQVRAACERMLAGPFEFRLGLALVMLATAVILDLFSSRETALLEEVLEFSASVALIAAVSATALKTRRPAGFHNIPEQGPRAEAAPAGPGRLDTYDRQDHRT